MLELRLRTKAGFDASAEAGVAIAKYIAVNLKANRPWDDVGQFLLEHEDARFEMIRVGQLRTNGDHSVQRGILGIQQTCGALRCAGGLSGRTYAASTS